jgi:3-hydroxybutyryl-CoA dehydratase
MPNGPDKSGLSRDRIRFLRAAPLGDTIRIVYRVAEVDAARRRASSEAPIANQHNEPAAVAVHILKWARET